MTVRADCSETSTCFNEAGSVRSRKRRTAARTAGRSDRFNEAGSVRSRKPARGALEGTDPVWASMRPAL